MNQAGLNLDCDHFVRRNVHGLRDVARLTAAQRVEHDDLRDVLDEGLVLRGHCLLLVLRFDALVVDLDVLSRVGRVGAVESMTQECKSDTKRQATYTRKESCFLEMGRSPKSSFFFFLRRSERDFLGGTSTFGLKRNWSSCRNSTRRLG